MNNVKWFSSSLRQLLISTVLLLLAFSSHAAVDNKGTEFVLSLLRNYDNDVTIEVHLTSDVATDVTLNYPMNSPTFTITVAVVPGDITIVELPDDTATVWAPDSIQNNSVHAVADAEFVVYLVNRRPFSSDAALALPVDTMNTEYIVATFTPSSNSDFVVTAGFNDTNVNITPVNAMTGRAAGVPFNVTLDRGESYYGSSASGGVNGDLTGTLITSSRPVGMVNGNRCTNIPVGAGYCDHIFEVSQPVQSWGNSSIAAPLPSRPDGSIYRILASQDNTSLSRNGVNEGMINRGEFIQTEPVAGEQVFSANNPIFVLQFMTGSTSPGSGGIGDPAMGNVIPADQFFNEYTFSTVGGNQFAQHYLSIVAQNSDVGSLMLDGAPVASAEFTPIPSTSMSAAVIPLSDGTHETSSANPHGITVEGYNTDDSYLYPGGALFEFINPFGDPYAPVCSGTLSGVSYMGVVTDERPSEDVNGNGVLDPGEDLNGNEVIDADTGVFFVEGTTLVNASFTVNPFTPGDDEAMFQVDWIDSSAPGSALITGTDGAGNTCTLEVEFGDDVPPPMQCDFDGDENVDKDDISAMMPFRNTPTGSNTAMDMDADGTITMLDVRKCILMCTNPGCAVIDAL